MVCFAAAAACTNRVCVCTSRFLSRKFLTFYSLVAIALLSSVSYDFRWYSVSFGRFAPFDVVIIVLRRHVRKLKISLQYEIFSSVHDTDEVNRIHLYRNRPFIHLFFVISFALAKRCFDALLATASRCFAFAACVCVCAQENRFENFVALYFARHWWRHTNTAALCMYVRGSSVAKSCIRVFRMLWCVISPRNKHQP